jgi:hypothetical protein
MTAWMLWMAAAWIVAGGGVEGGRWLARRRRWRMAGDRRCRLLAAGGTVERVRP